LLILRRPADRLAGTSVRITRQRPAVGAGACMDRQTYDSYLRAFNARDYDGVLGWFAPDFEVSFGGYRLTSAKQVKDFYSFLHAYVSEEILVDRFVGDADFVALEARVRLTGLKPLPPEAARAAGFEHLRTPQAGQTIEISQFIHYHLENGKFKRALCAVL
jgi:SnoaL-like domain